MMSSPHATAANSQRIGAQVLTLLGNYWTADESREVRALFIDTWVADLEDFDAEIVAAACRDWRLNENRRTRPMSGDIRQLCVEIQANRALKLTQRTTLTEDEITAAGDSYARSHGFASMSEMQRSPGFRSVSIKVGPRQFHRFEPIRDEPLPTAKAA